MKEFHNFIEQFHDLSIVNNWTVYITIVVEWLKRIHYLKNPFVKIEFYETVYIDYGELSFSLHLAEMSIQITCDLYIILFGHPRIHACNEGEKTFPAI